LFTTKIISDTVVTTIPENRQITAYLYEFDKVATGLSLRIVLIVFIGSKVLVELVTGQNYFRKQG